MIYKLIKIKKNIKFNYELICKLIPSSIFSRLGAEFFQKLVNENIINVYNVRNGKNILSVITVINYKNYKLIDKQIFFHLIFRPITLIKNLFFLINSLSKNINLRLNQNYLHLLHLIILKNKFTKISISKKDLLFNKFYKKILNEHHAKIFFLCFEKENIRAIQYYKRNKFKFFLKKKNIIYAKKEFKI